VNAFVALKETVIVVVERQQTKKASIGWQTGLSWLI